MKRRALGAALALASLALLVPVASAQAAGIPGIDICDPDAPLPQKPTDGLVGMLTTRPANITGKVGDKVVDPAHLYTSGGFAGFESSIYDLGCAADPRNYTRQIDAGFNQRFGNGAVSLGASLEAITDSIERRAWNPTWITTFLSDFAQRATDVLDRKIWIPLLGLGLLAASAMLILAARKGNMAMVAAGAAWAILVIVLGSAILRFPLVASTSVQSAGSGVASMLNAADGDPTDATTDSVVQAVQYQGWLRRTFGSSESAVAKELGPKMLAASRISWAEMDDINSRPADERPDAMKKLNESKQKDWEKVARQVKDADPGAYRYVQGDPQVDGMGPPTLEMLFGVASSGFRLVADLLMVTAVILLAMLGLAWLAGSPFIATPSGVGLGKTLLNNAARSFGYVIMAAVGVWLYTIYLGVALAPGMTAWWSLLLLIMGSIIFWTALRPDRKMISMLSAGQVDGTGKVVSVLKAAVIGWFGGKVAGREVADEINDQRQNQPTPSEEVAGPTVQATAYDLPPVAALPQYSTVPRPAWPMGMSEGVEGNVTTPAARPGVSERPAPGVIVGEVIEAPEPTRTVPIPVLPSGQPVYQHGVPEADAASPPPSGAVGDVEVYQRPVSTDPDEAPVPCPWCSGAGCGHCQGTGSVPTWVRNQVEQADASATNEGS